MKIEDVNPNDLKFRDNVRWRADSDLSELMESIKQQGIQSPIKARTEDKTIIYGHRRVAAAIKLNLQFVPVIYESGIDDKRANILNMLENMHRKDVTSIEIGRQCDSMLKEKKFNLSIDEMSVLLGVSSNRIRVCIDAFKRLPPKFRDKVVHLDNAKNRKFGELPENVVFGILNFGRNYKKLDDQELNLFLQRAADKKLTCSQIVLIGYLFASGMPLKKALKEVDLYTIARMNFAVLKTEYQDALKKEGVKGKQILFNTIIKSVYPNLLY